MGKEKIHYSDTLRKAIKTGKKFVPGEPLDPITNAELADAGFGEYVAPDAYGDYTDEQRDKVNAAKEEASDNEWQKWRKARTAKKRRRMIMMIRRRRGKTNKLDPTPAGAGTGGSRKRKNTRKRNTLKNMFFW
jgi:hypothetical protein